MTTANKSDLAGFVQKTLREEMQRGEQRNRQRILDLASVCNQKHFRSGIKVILERILDELDAAEQTLGMLEEQLRVAQGELEEAGHEERQAREALSQLEPELDLLKDSLRKCSTLADFERLVKNMA